MYTSGGTAKNGSWSGVRGGVALFVFVIAAQEYQDYYYHCTTVCNIVCFAAFALLSLNLRSVGGVSRSLPVHAFFAVEIVSQALDLCTLVFVRVPRIVLTFQEANSSNRWQSRAHCTTTVNPIF